MKWEEEIYLLEHLQSSLDETRNDMENIPLVQIRPRDIKQTLNRLSVLSQDMGDIIRRGKKAQVSSDCAK